MMKKLLILPNTIFRPILVSIPLLFIFVSAIRMNDAVQTFGKLYPLIIFSGLAVVFTFVFFFRPVILSHDEIKSIGPFSSRDKAIINMDKTLILTERGSGLISIDLFGNDGMNADLDWLKGENVLHDTYLFKSKVVGGVHTMKKILLFFGADEALADEILSADAIERETYGMQISSSKIEENKEIRIKFTANL